MKTLRNAITEFALKDGEFIYVEASILELEGTVRPAGRDEEIPRKAEQSFQDSTRRIKTVVGSFVDEFRDLPNFPDELELEFGVKLNATVGAVIVSGGAEANYRIVLKWKKK